MQKYPRELVDRKDQIVNYSRTRPAKGFIIMAPSIIITGAVAFTGNSARALIIFHWNAFCS